MAFINQVICNNTPPIPIRDDSSSFINTNELNESQAENSECDINSLIDLKTEIAAKNENDTTKAPTSYNICNEQNKYQHKSNFNSSLHLTIKSGQDSPLSCSFQKSVDESTKNLFHDSSDKLETISAVVVADEVNTQQSSHQEVINTYDIKTADLSDMIEYQSQEPCQGEKFDTSMHEEDKPCNDISQEEKHLKYPELFVCNNANEAHEIIKCYAEETMTTFVSMRKMKHYGITEGGIDLSRKNYRVFFESSDIQFDGIPYIYVADKMYICHLGKDKTEVTRQKIRQQSMQKKLQMGLPATEASVTRIRTKKIDCPVKITVKMIAKFPQFKVTRKTKRVCETASKKVRLALQSSNGNAPFYYSFVGRLPAMDEHNHSVGENNTDKEPIDPTIKDKIIQLTWEGSNTPKDIQTQLDDFVEIEMFAGKEAPPKSRRRYYPNLKDIRNYMNKAKLLTRLSSDARADLQNLSTKLQQSRPSETFIVNVDNFDSGQCDDTSPLVMFKNEVKPSMVFCHQTNQQQRLLKRYGSQVVLCEITYMIQCIPFPLFGVFVQTNVDHQFVGVFIVQMRNKESILSGLTAFKEWNPNWQPKYITIDYSDDQKNAVNEVFPGITMFISDYSRLHSWREWLKKGDSSVDEVFHLFESIANAYNESVLHEAALHLENSDVWRGSANLRNWFNSKWLVEAKKWIVGYRPDDFYVCLHKTKFIEQDIESLQFAHINLIRGKKIGSLIEKLVETIIPDSYQRYVELNRKSHTQANELKVLYGDQLPICLVDKPASVIVHILEQMKATESTVYQVSHIQPGLFLVQDACRTEEDSESFSVSFGDSNSLPSCNCASWQKYKLPCQHLCSVFRSFPDWGWDMLNTVYTSNPLINIDYSCIKPWVDIHNMVALNHSHSVTKDVEEPNLTEHCQKLLDLLHKTSNSEHLSRLMSNLKTSINLLKNSDGGKQGEDELMSCKKYEDEVSDSSYVTDEEQIGYGMLDEQEISGETVEVSSQDVSVLSQLPGEIERVEDRERKLLDILTNTITS